MNTSVLLDGRFRGWSVDSKELPVSVPPAKLPQAALGQFLREFHGSMFDAK